MPGLAGALSVVFAPLARLVATRPGAVLAGFASASGRHLVPLQRVIAAVLVAEQVVTAARGIAQVDGHGRYGGYLLGRVMRVVLAAPWLELF